MIVNCREFGKKKGKKKGGDDSDMSDDFGEDDDDDGGADLDGNLSDEEVAFSDDGDFMAQFKDADDVDLEEEEGEEVGGSGAEASLGFNEEDVEFSDDGKL